MRFRLKSPLTWLVLICIFAGVGELVARFGLGLGDPPLFISHSSIEYMLKPDQDVRRFHRRYQINQYGMRSEPFDRVKQDGQLRVLVFGDSVINGAGLTDQSELATSLLKQRLQQAGFENVVVGNVSAGSWGPGNWRAYAEEFGFFEADVVILVLSSHDYADNPAYQGLDRVNQPQHKPVSALLEGIRRYVPQIWKQLLGKEPEKGLLPTPVTDADIGRALNDLKAFLMQARQGDRKVIVFQHWEKSELESGQPETGYKLIKRLAESLDVSVISLEPYFSQAVNQGENPYRDFIHVNALGQTLISEAMTDALKADDFHSLDSSAASE